MKRYFFSTILLAFLSTIALAEESTVSSSKNSLSPKSAEKSLFSKSAVVAKPLALQPLPTGLSMQLHNPQFKIERQYSIVVDSEPGTEHEFNYQEGNFVDSEGTRSFFADDIFYIRSGDETRTINQEFQSFRWEEGQPIPTRPWFNRWECEMSIENFDTLTGSLAKFASFDMSAFKIQDGAYNIESQMHVDPINNKMFLFIQSEKITYKFNPVSIGTNGTFNLWGWGIAESEVYDSGEIYVFVVSGPFYQKSSTSAKIDNWNRE